MPYTPDFTSSVSPFASLLGLSTGSIYALDPTGTVPLSPIADIIPGLTERRITLSMIEQESQIKAFRVTTNRVQDFSDVTSNVHRELIRINLTGIISSVFPFNTLGITAPTGGVRIDLIAASRLEKMADKRRPVMVVTPRISLARAFIESLERPWSPDDGQSTRISITFVEARIASPFSVAVIPDVTTLAAGNSSGVGGGEQALNPQTTSATAPGVAQAAPNIGGI